MRGQGSLFQQGLHESRGVTWFWGVLRWWENDVTTLRLEEGLHGMGGPGVVGDWSSQLWLGLPGLEGLPGLRMVGDWSSWLWMWFSGLYLHGMVGR